MMAKNSNFNYKPMSNVLSANHGSGALAVAEDIAYDWTDTETNPMGGYEFVMSKSVKEKISEIEQTISNIDIPEIDANQIEEYRDEALQKYQDASALSTAAQRTYTNTINEINNTVSSLEAKEATINSKVEDLSEIADQLSSVFDANADFIVLTQAQYNELVNNGDVNDNTMYFIYSEQNVTYTVFANTNNSDLGSVVIKNSANETVTYIHDGRNASYTLIATPNNEAEFVNWTVVSSEGSTIASTSASLSITLSKDALYIANFQLIGE